MSVAIWADSALITIAPDCSRKSCNTSRESASSSINQYPLTDKRSSIADRLIFLDDDTLRHRVGQG